ncbi:MAG: glycosyltransferase family 2 protein [Bacteroidetes bacterium]|nr:glycosyltransferase family 2 protein [Bacteroidota bacterium]
MLLSIIIINYKSASLIMDCLESLYQRPGPYPFEILVVDNSPGDGARERVTEAFPAVTWIPIDYNAGFARANNEGIRRSKGDAVLLLNGDTLPDGATVETCYRRLTESRYIAAGVQLLNPDGSPQISGMYAMKGGLNYLLPLPFLGKWIKAAGESFGVKKPHVADAPGAGPIEVDWINGAFLMVKKNILDESGLLDEDFFLYAEEAEWCSRLKKTGPLCIYGDLHVIHLQGETANQEFGSTGKGYYNFYDRKGLQIMLSNFVRIRKQFGRGWFFIQLFFYLLDVPIFFFGVLFAGRKSGLSFFHLRRFCKNLGAILSLTPKIIKNKPYFYKVL